MNDLRHRLEEKYNALFVKYGLERPLDARKVNCVIRNSLNCFLQNAKTPAIYCNGGHTQMLMADFMYDLKKVRYLVDNYTLSEGGGGFQIIRDEELEEKKIDAVILSTYKFRRDVRQSMKEQHPNIPVLDLYDELEKNGIKMEADYYYSNHPYHHYHRINQLQRDIEDVKKRLNTEGKAETCAKGAKNKAMLDSLYGLYRQLITKYIHIKDFRTALTKIREFGDVCSVKTERAAEKVEALYHDVRELYELELQGAVAVSEDNVLMFCLDGLRRQDLSEQDMPKMKKILDETAYSFTNAYSFSTSTYESLIPVYSENSDMRTRYYEKNVVDTKDCRFMGVAEGQNRKVYVYGDIDHYIEGDTVCYSDRSQTVTEKLWNFVLDGCGEEKGLFYIHELYESHFTFSNPYTTEPLKSEGTAMLFDFLPAKGGGLRADYEAQHKDALRYLDDVLEPFLERFTCRMVLYADHGNLILDKGTEITEIGDTEYTCSEGWTRIPLVIRSPEAGVGKNDSLISLMELNSIVVSLLLKQSYLEGFTARPYIKLARSELYNPDFRELYRRIGKEQYLQAFECFRFADGYKLIVFANGYTELYTVRDDHAVQDNVKKEDYLEKIRGEITVWDVLMQ